MLSAKTTVADEVAVEPVHDTDAATLPAVVEHHEPVGVSFTADQVALLKETVCNPGVDRQGKQQYATDAELDLFLAVCRRTGLDPFARQIYAVFRWNPALGRKAMQVQTSIDGFRVIAERSSTYAGQAGPFWCGPDGKWSDVWLADGYPAAARVGVLRRGFSEPMYAVAKWSEFVQTNQDGSVAKMWQALPTVMLAKCAEAQALRRAFPNDLSGLYVAEEMGQADNTATPSPPQWPLRKPAAKQALLTLITQAGLSGPDALALALDLWAEAGNPEEVTEGQWEALEAAARVRFAIPDAPEFDVDGDGQGAPNPSLALFAELEPKVTDLVAKYGDHRKPPGSLLTNLILTLKRFGVEEGDDQRDVLGALLGEPVHSRATLTAGQAKAVLDVLAEESAGV